MNTQKKTNVPTNSDLNLHTTFPYVETGTLMGTARRCMTITTEQRRRRSFLFALLMQRNYCVYSLLDRTRTRCRSEPSKSLEYWWRPTYLTWWTVRQAGHATVNWSVLSCARRVVSVCLVDRWSHDETNNMLQHYAPTTSCRIWSEDGGSTELVEPESNSWLDHSSVVPSPSHFARWSSQCCMLFVRVCVMMCADCCHICTDDVPMWYGRSTAQNATALKINHLASCAITTTTTSTDIHLFWYNKYVHLCEHIKYQQTSEAHTHKNVHERILHICIIQFHAQHIRTHTH